MKIFLELKETKIMTKNILCLLQKINILISYNEAKNYAKEQWFLESQNN